MGIAGLTWTRLSAAWASASNSLLVIVKSADGNFWGSGLEPKIDTLPEFLLDEVLAKLALIFE